MHVYSRYVVLFFWFLWAFTHSSFVLAQDSSDDFELEELNKRKRAELIHTMLELGISCQGMPYNSLYKSQWRLDCSGFVSMLYSSIGITLPRSSADMAKFVQTIPLRKVKPGDLLFFKGTNLKDKTIGHVAIVVSVQSENITILHSTLSKGVIMEQYPDKYYYIYRFVKCGRVKL